MALPSSFVVAFPPMSGCEACALAQDALYGCQDGIVDGLMAKVLEHHRTGPVYLVDLSAQADPVCAV